MSPWWLVRKGRVEEAEHAVKRLTHESTHKDVKNTVAMMIHSNELERLEAEGTTYLQCSNGTDARRTEIVMMVLAMQRLSGESK